ncbi:glycosyltransferase family 2 protein [Pedobacter sp. BMA]|uniref:glycosyltransferase family 2 protein n=1 Tax=Pedobacter sp. BMA TaxID=1663685 RepID=UPI00064932FD|nr:glycosyltransferase family 2 protein [Pedobacter sp. BMA]KLT66995.1 glycosyl transferase [Pedobacter sp. BMA]
MAITSIVTVNYNQPEATLALLASIKLNLNLENLEVIIVDNGSLIDSGASFKAFLPQTIYIRSEANLGFAGGNNLGIKVASGEYILMVNNDTEVVKGMTDVLIKEMEANPEIGIVTPLILYFDQPDTIQYAGYTPMNYTTCRNKTEGLMEKNTGQYMGMSNETAFCHGAAMMCRKADIMAIGLMPEMYFLYYEELDWCEMFKKAGKKIWFTGKTHIFHKESISVGRESALKTYFVTRNRILFIRRNANLFNQIAFAFYFTGIAIPKQMIIYILKKRTDLIPYLRRALTWNITQAKDSLNLGFNRVA